MNDMKLGIRLLRYAYGIKMNVVLMIVCAAGDILCLALELMRVEADYTGMGGFLLFGVGMVPVQLLFSLNTVGAVLSSPVRKKLQTSFPAALSWWAMSGVYLILVLQKLAAARMQPERTEQICAQLASLAVLGAMLMAITVFAYKSKVLFLGVMFVLNLLVQFYFYGVLHWEIFENDSVSLLQSALLGFVLIAAGAAMEYGFLRLIYKKPVLQTRGLGAPVG